MSILCRELETSIIFSERKQLKEIITKMILDSTVSTEVINVILEFLRMDSLTDMITDMLNNDNNEMDLWVDVFLWCLLFLSPSLSV